MHILSACAQPPTYGAYNDGAVTTYSETVLTDRSTIGSTATVKCTVKAVQCSRNLVN